MERIQRDISARSSTHISEKRIKSKRALARVPPRRLRVHCRRNTANFHRKYIDRHPDTLPLAAERPSSFTDLTGESTSRDSAFDKPTSGNRLTRRALTHVSRENYDETTPPPLFIFSPICYLPLSLPPCSIAHPVRLIEHFDFSQTRHRSTLRFIAAIFLLSCRSLPCSYFLLQITYDV